MSALKLVHHFGPTNKVAGVDVGTYIKESFFPAGAVLPMHTHVHSHLSVLCQGWAELSVDGVTQELRGPKIITIEAGRQHSVKALSAITWLCIHATDERDPEKIDEKLVDHPND